LDTKHGKILGSFFEPTALLVPKHGENSECLLSSTHMMTNQPAMTTAMATLYRIGLEWVGSGLLPAGCVWLYPAGGSERAERRRHRWK
jgi:hypothetical protein